jgi:hypothetical protein
LKRFFRIVFWGVIIVGYLIYRWTTNHSAEDVYFKNFHLDLQGVVTAVDIPESSNGFGIIRVRILTSNIDDYDPRGKYKFYYCLIKRGIAEFYQGGASSCNVDDTVSVNTDNRVFLIVKPGRTVTQSIVLYDDNPAFFRYAESTHQKF